MTKMPELSPEKIKEIVAAVGWNLSDTVLIVTNKIAKAQRELLKGWIPLPSDERMADITAKAGGLPSPEWKTILEMLQEGDEQER